MFEFLNKNKKKKETLRRVINIALENGRITSMEFYLIDLLIDESRFNLAQCYINEFSVRKNII